MKQRLKRALFGLLGKDPEAVVVTFLSGAPELAARMQAEVREILPKYRHVSVQIGDRRHNSRTTRIMSPVPDLHVRPGHEHADARRALRHYRIGMAAVLFDGDSQYRALRRAAVRLAPGRILAYNARLERHHLRLRTALASYLFLRGVPVHRIYARPRWLTPWRRPPEETVERQVFHGRPFGPGRSRVLIVTPYVPWPLSHGGAVRMYHLLRDAAREFDLVLFAFTEGGSEELDPLLEFCSAIVLVPKREHLEPRWSTLGPPEPFEYDSPALRQALDRTKREFQPDLVQVEYTALAGFGGDILVEHDITFDLHRQICERERTAAAWWNWWRWRRFETRALRKFRRAVVMSEKDAALAEGRSAVVIPNGVDLARFSPRAEAPGERLLFIGSFRHFPNIVAFRFFTEQVWPLVRDKLPHASLTVVAGPDPEVYWRAATGTLAPPQDPSVRLLGFVRDVVPLYVDANLVVVPTLVSAGTNLKLLEAMAMRRAVVSTTSGCAGLGLAHGESVWIADDPRAFAAGILGLLEDPALRERIAAAARRIAEERYGWEMLGAAQRALYREMIGSQLRVRLARSTDIDALDRIQRGSPEAVLWDPHTYLAYECRVAEINGTIAGFVVSRVAGGEGEVLSLIVDPAFRRRGIAARLLEAAMHNPAESWFLEVRESNWPARNLYRKFGFEEVALRAAYYQDNGETAVVMRRQKC